MSAVNGPL